MSYCTGQLLHTALLITVSQLLQFAQLLHICVLLLVDEVLAQLLRDQAGEMLWFLLGAVYPLSGCETLAQLALGQADIMPGLLML